MKNTIALAALAAGLLAAPASAQDRGGAPGGLYVGALAGYEGLEVSSTTGTATATADSAVYGLDAGYDLNLGNAFVGIEGEISTSNGSTTFPGTIAGAREGLDTNGQYYLGARAGLALTPGIAAYGKVGYTALDTRAFTQSGSLSDLKDNTDGLRFGGGVQIQLPGPLEARIEYRRSTYKDLAEASQDRASTNQVVAGIGVRF
jgi:outer membrane immunogenic protein